MKKQLTPEKKMKKQLTPDMKYLGCLPVFW